MNHRHHSTPTAVLRRCALGLCLVASGLAPLVVGSGTAAAAPGDTISLELRDVTGARVARAGAPATVRATVDNTGAVDATGVEVRYQLPPGLTFVADASPGCAVSGTLVTCSVGDVAAGGSAPVEVAVREQRADAVLGTRTGYFLPPTSDGYDAGAGELRRTTWFHESGQEGTALGLCWPIDNPTPSMDVAGGDCDGVVDAAPLAPDDIDLLTAFPEPFSESLVRSWQFDTEIVAPTTGSYRACGARIDDGGYLAIAPVGEPFTAAAIVLDIDAFDDAVTGDAFDLVGGTRYRVVMRISNRGGAGPDNGANGGTLAGWDAYGIAPASRPCDATSDAVFGTADTAWVDRTAADVVVVGRSDLAVVGAVESAAVDGRRDAAVRLANLGPDGTAARLTFDLPDDGRVTTTIEGCTPAAGSATTCDIDDVGPTDPTSDGLLVTLGFAGDRGLGWSITALSTVDDERSNDRGRLTAP